VVDHDFNIIDFNLAGAKLLDRVPFAVLRLRGGGQLQCIIRPKPRMAASAKLARNAS
jgi:hypothetical protein